MRGISSEKMGRGNVGARGFEGEEGWVLKRFGSEEAWTDGGEVRGRRGKAGRAPRK
jgi:hypothetical protein